ncbi:metallophosphoesterase [Sphingomonas sp. 1P06PA]|uniref:metallophosphoesterase family protein n=1 Tax=Sphingomonas sp. 1P06PA TaxID=554121 RepID=UPI0039A4C88E
MTRLFHVSDLHFGRADEAALDWFARTVRQERPDAVIVTGDLTMRARSAEYEAATTWLRGLGVPLSIEPGNHDLPYFNPIARIFSPYKRYKRVERALEKPLDIKGIWLVPLRTTARAQWRLNWSFGIVNRRSLKAALARLRRCPPDHVAIVACHHPLVDQGLESEGRTRRGEAALALLAEAGADAVLSGHVHDAFDVPHRIGDANVRLIGAGTLSERVRATRPSFNELRIADGAISVATREMA